jgi:hypothetical protein
MSRGRSVWSRVVRLEGVRRRAAGGACAVCGGGGYPGTFVMTGNGEPEQVGSWSCAGCGRVRVGAVVILPGSEGWAGADDDGRPSEGVRQVNWARQIQNWQICLRSPAASGRCTAWRMSLTRRRC